MIEKIIEYKKIVKEIPTMMRTSYYKNDFFIKNLNLKQATFYRKLRDNDFSVDEIETIVLLLRPEEKLLMSLAEGLDDYKNNRTEKHEQVMSQLRKEYSI